MWKMYVKTERGSSPSLLCIIFLLRSWSVERIMKRGNAYVPSSNLEYWRNLLADREKQWVRKYSAFELAHAWTRSEQFPESLKYLFKQTPHDMFHDLEMVLKIPEHQVYLDTRKAPSQNDLFVIARTETDLMTMMIEGKVKEPFGPTVEECLEEASEVKHKRLDFLMNCLRLNDLNQLRPIRYQLLHRTASALIEAQKYHAKNAVMLVHSFCLQDSSLDEYQAFLKLYGLRGEKNMINGPVLIGGVNLYLGWISDPPSTDMNVIWQAICSHEGETFRQIMGGEFKYEIRGNYLIPDRTNVQISKKSIEESLQYYPFPNTSVIQHLRAPSYLYAILMDDRIQQNYFPR
jgi:hypothetical protein